MTDLITFLRARLDEDEAYARQIIDAPDCDYAAEWDCPASALVHVGETDWDLPMGDSRLAYHVARWDPARVLAEVAAKRAIIDLTLNYEARIDGEWGCCHGPEEIAAGECPASLPAEIPALLALAQPYAAHRDFDPTWSKP